MSVKIAGLVDCFDSPDFGRLTEHRSVASTSFLGRYTFVDFPLSNFYNSHITSIGILCQNHMRSLTKHIGNGRMWNANTKLGRVEFLYDEPNVSRPGYSTDVADLEENRAFLKEVHPDYVVIAAPQYVYEADFGKLVKAHIASGDRVSLLYSHVEKGLKESFIGSDLIKISSKGKVTALEENLGEEDAGDVSIGCVIMDYPMLESLMEYARSTSAFFNLKDCLKYLAPTNIIKAVKFDGYVRCFDSMAHYLEYSLELLNRNVFNSLFKDEWTIHTRSYDTPPSVYYPGSDVKKSYLANGCDIHGEVFNSIIARNVTIGKGAVVKNCVIFNDVTIAEGTHIENAIIDRDAQVLHVSEIIGSKDEPVYVSRGDII